MKAYIPLIALCALTACGTSHGPAQPATMVDRSTVISHAPAPAPTTIYKLKGYEGPEAMSTQEVRQAQKLCILSKMMPVTQYIAVRTDTGSKVQVPIGVDCEAF
jgi:hypothetical protein